MKYKLLRVLIIEDSGFDAMFVIRELKKGGYNCMYERVETAAAMKKAVREKQWDIILCDYTMPDFNVPSAIAVLTEANIDAPIIIVSGTMGEETAIECMRLGARDYIMKSNLSRLCPAIARELKEVKVRSKQKRAEEALRNSEARYRNIFENAMEGIFQATIEGRFIIANAAFAHMAGYDSPEELIGSVKNIGTQIYVNPEDRKRVMEILTEKGSIDGTEVELYKKDGSRFLVVINARTVKDEKGKILCTEGLIEDITLRKLAEQQLHQTLESLKKAVGVTIQVLVSALEARDPYTAGHQSRVAHLACAIAAEMELPQDKIEGLRMAGSIHDIGKLSIPAEILSKPAKLTNIEFSLIKEHSQSGYEMLRNVESPWPLAQIVYQHHERMNGSGYPRNLKGDEILFEARILAVADVVEAMASHRPYRVALGIGAALDEIKNNKGILYDSAVVDACLKLFHEKGYRLA